METISALDQNYNKLFLRNEFRKFSRAFYNDEIYRTDSYLWSNENLKLELKPQVDIGDILELMSFKMN